MYVSKSDKPISMKYLCNTCTYVHQLARSRQSLQKLFIMNADPEKWLSISESLYVI